MEKIKAAIAKVKSSKSKVSETSVKEKATAVSVQAKANYDIGNIEYTNTTVVTLNSKHLERNRIVSHLSHNATAGVFDSLRTQLLQKMADNNWQTVAIVSPTPDSGKTLVSINLALSMAKQPQRTVLLADFDLRKPKVASYLGIQAKKSINDYLSGSANIDEILINPSIQRLIVMPTMQPVIGASEMLSSNKIVSLVEELKDRYESRIILFDLPPLLNADDAMVVLPHVDCVLLVVGNGVSTPDEIEDALLMIPQDRLLGTVYNMADEEMRRYYY